MINIYRCGVKFNNGIVMQVSEISTVNVIENNAQDLIQELQEKNITYMHVPQEDGSDVRLFFTLEHQYLEAFLKGLMFR